MNKKKIGQAAQDVLRNAADTIDARATERGEVQERSMARTVAMFNAHWDTNLTEQQGWSFMQHLKAARNRSGHKDDDLLDKTAYAALEAECVLQKYNGPVKPLQSPIVDSLIAKPKELSNFLDIKFYIYIDKWQLVKVKDCYLEPADQLIVNMSIVPMGTEKAEYYTSNWTSVENFTELYIPLTACTLETAMEVYDYLTHNYVQEPK